MLKELTNALRSQKNGSSLASSSTRLKSQFDASNKITIKQMQKKQKVSKPNPQLSQERINSFCPKFESATVDNSRNFDHSQLDIMVKNRDHSPVTPLNLASINRTS